MLPANRTPPHDLVLWQAETRCTMWATHHRSSGLCRLSAVGPSVKFQSRLRRWRRRPGVRGNGPVTRNGRNLPFSGVLNPGGDHRAKNAGGRGHRAAGARSGGAVAYQVVVVLASTNTLFLYNNAYWGVGRSGTAKYRRPRNGSLGYRTLLFFHDTSPPWPLVLRRWGYPAYRGLRVACP